MKDFIKFFEIPATDVKRAVDFYQKVFEIEIVLHDWGVEKMGMFPDHIGSISQAEGFKPCEHGTLITFDGGTDLSVTMKRVIKNGGKEIIAKTKIEADDRGYFAVFLDSEGNRIGLYSDN